jgi:predicted TPR repeat methyltransferase
LHKDNAIEKAIIFYNQALHLDPNYVNCYYNLGLIYQDKGDIQEASKQYATVIALDPNHVESRLNQCNILFAIEDLVAAEECYIEIIQIQPNYVRGLVNLASLYVSSGSSEEIYLQRATQLYSAALDIDPTNRMALHGLRSLTASVESNNTDSNNGEDEGMDVEYVRELFDSYSFHFDSSLRSLNYSAPWLVASLLADHLAELPSEPSVLSVLDLGAGTGLVCEALRNMSTQTSFAITAVDVSAKMLAKARERKCYDTIEQGDITAFLAEKAAESSLRRVEVIVLADVLVYFGELRTVLRACLDLLTDGGVVLFTVEDLQANSLLITGEASSLSFALQRSGRFGHSSSYIEALAVELGFELWRLLECVPRTDSGVAVRGLAVGLKKKARVD